MGIAKHRENTKAPQKIFYFCPFSAYFSPFCPCSRCSHSPEPQGTAERNGNPFCTRSGPQAPEGLKPGPKQDRGTEAQHHPPTRQGTQQDQLPRWCRSCQPIRNATREREAERGEGKGKPSKPTKKGTPPMGRVQAALPLITNSRQKISKKSLGVDLKKFSEKFFGGMFRGKEKPLALSQRKGVV